MFRREKIMSWFTSILSGGVDKIVDSVGTAVDKIVTSDEERLILKNELAKIQLDAKYKQEALEVQFEQEITSRWKSDNEHGLTRLVRPAIVVWSFALLTIVVIADGNLGNFAVRAEYIPLVAQIVVASVVSYMGARSFDKYTKNK